MLMKEEEEYHPSRMITQEEEEEEENGLDEWFRLVQFVTSGLSFATSPSRLQPTSFSSINFESALAMCRKNSHPCHALALDFLFGKASCQIISLLTRFVV